MRSEGLAGLDGWLDTGQGISERSAQLGAPAPRLCNGCSRVLSGERRRRGMGGYLASDGPEHKITTKDVGTGKNYLSKVAFRQLEILYERLFLFAENKIVGGDTMTLAKWEEQLQKLLVANGFEPKGMYEGPFLPTKAVEKAEHELRLYKGRQAIKGPPS